MKAFNYVTCLTSLLVSTSALSAPPGKAVIDWGQHTYQLVEIDKEKNAYQEIVGSVHDSVGVPVSWQVWSGEPAETVNVLLDGQVVWSGEGSLSNAIFAVSEGGMYKMSVQLCNTDGCSESESVDLTIADTDGSHLEPLNKPLQEKNQPYSNKTGKVVASYFVEWGIYGRGYTVDQIPAQNLTHLLYAFVPICGGDGINDSLKQIENGQSFNVLQTSCDGQQDFEVSIHDPFAAINKSQENVSDYAQPYRGNFGQLMALKRAYPDLTILPSIGGWTLSDPFYFMHDASKRQVFINSVKAYLRTWKFFDGVDIDWEYPGGGGANANLGDEKDGELYVTIMQELRTMLDELEAETGREYQLTSAIGVAANKIDVVDYSQAQQYMDYIFLMSYDMFGAWDLNILGHQSGLYEASHQPAVTHTADRGVNRLLQQGVSPAKIALGVPMYGRGWQGVTDYTDDNPMTGKATGPINGTWEAGMLDYRDIVDNHSGSGWVTRYDQQAQASYRWNEETKELISFDNKEAVKAKGQYVIQHGLAGLFSWEIDADNGEVLNAMHEGLGHGDGDTQPPSNSAPIANAGDDQSVVGPADVILDGSRSYDPDRDNISYTWQQTSGDNLVLTDSNNVRASVSVPATDSPVSYGFSLMVTDESGLSSSDVVNITNQVAQDNQPPTVTLPVEIRVDSEETFSVTAQASDPDGNALTYSWNVGSEFEIVSGQGSATLSLNAPKVEESVEHGLSLSVSDGDLLSSAQTRIVVNPISEGEECRLTDPNAGNFESWSATNIYVSGEQVSHDNLVWRAKWWNQGSEPSLSATQWQLVSDIELSWNADLVFVGGDEINHNGRRWKARWWNQNSEPGINQVWDDIGVASCE
ncbi:glycosyl hydrolase family 18 protein [Vibrio sp. S4M6]|uniref:glycosyl hydrolase family 18 protein n=1 Tax=Vibrio sinus TaxID=2946865 RepID=UPI00202A8DA7|nr:glycosyl hydrolase family 18 protein [Vibrio sinus]MCL9779927.1 glycosyl hydrolase family 18 protein [Vibrio sinus]